MNFLGSNIKCILLYPAPRCESVVLQYEYSLLQGQVKPQLYLLKRVAQRVIAE